MAIYWVNCLASFGQGVFVAYCLSVALHLGVFHPMISLCSLLRSMKPCVRMRQCPVAASAPHYRNTPVYYHYPTSPIRSLSVSRHQRADSLPAAHLLAGWQRVSPTPFSAKQTLGGSSQLRRTQTTVSLYVEPAAKQTTSDLHRWSGGVH